MVLEWKQHLRQVILSCAALLLPSSLYAGSSLSTSYSISQRSTVLPEDGHPLFCPGCPNPHRKAALILKRTERPRPVVASRGLMAAGRGLSLKLRGGNSDTGAENQTVAHTMETTEVSSPQPRGWGLTAEQSALYNNSLEEAGSMEYEVMAFLQVLLRTRWF